ncbi:hypothetical protein KIL84_017470, partial [Mauremys mutica]
PPAPATLNPPPRRRRRGPCTQRRGGAAQRERVPDQCACAGRKHVAAAPLAWSRGRAQSAMAAAGAACGGDAPRAPCAFSPGGRRSLALCGPDGRLRVWDTPSSRLQHEYVPSAHLSAACTCLAWAPPGGRQPPSKVPGREGTRGRAGSAAALLTAWPARPVRGRACSAPPPGTMWLPRGEQPAGPEWGGAPPTAGKQPPCDGDTPRAPSPLRASCLLPAAPCWAAHVGHPPPLGPRLGVVGPTGPRPGGAAP